MPEELQTEVCDILQEAVIKTILKKNQCKNATRFSKDALQIDEKRIEAESEGERENYSHFKLEFQSIGRRVKKGFLSDQCKEIEEKNRMGKTIDIFKKIRDNQGIFLEIMVKIKDRNIMDLMEAEAIKKRVRHRRTAQKAYS